MFTGLLTVAWRLGGMERAIQDLGRSDARVKIDLDKVTDETRTAHQMLADKIDSKTSEINRRIDSIVDQRTPV